MTAPGSAVMDDTATVHWRDLLGVLVDPVDGSELRETDEGLAGGGGRTYPIVGDQPTLLVDAAREHGSWRIPAVEAGQQLHIRPARSARRRWLERVKRAVRSSHPTNDVTDLIAGHLPPAGGSNVLIVGGGTEGAGSDGLRGLPDARVISFDVYRSPATTFVGDGHRIPLADGSMNVVWVQAVLEHVVHPQLVVDEITRVLAPGGLVYAETPFLQPVHEGPYDFTRFSHSGHRLLFGDYEEIASGPLGGPGALLSLGVRGLVGGLSRRTSMARLAYAATAWFGQLDRFVPAEWRVDFATGTYFLGAKRDGCPQIFDAEGYYRGAQ